MKKIEIYTTQSCPFCVRAKMLLDKKNAHYTEIDVSRDNELRLTMMEKAGGRTSVPQIFIADEHIGGFDDLQKLDQQGQLDAKLKD